MMAMLRGQRRSEGWRGRWNLVLNKDDCVLLSSISSGRKNDGWWVLRMRTAAGGWSTRPIIFFKRLVLKAGISILVFSVDGFLFFHDCYLSSSHNHHPFSYTMNDDDSSSSQQPIAIVIVIVIVSISLGPVWPAQHLPHHPSLKLKPPTHHPLINFNLCFSFLSCNTNLPINLHAAGWLL